MARTFVILCLAATFGNGLGQMNGRTEPTETEVNLFAENNVEKLFQHYDKDGNGKLSAAEQDKFLDGLQGSYGVELPADFKTKAKADHAYTLKEFQQVYSTMTTDFNKVQSDTIMDQTKALIEEMRKEQEIVNLMSSNNVDKIFAHYDKDGNGKLTPAEQDDFLNDLEKVSAVDLPASFKSKAKRAHGMDKQEFKQIYSQMSDEFQTTQTEALKEEMKKNLKAEFTEMLTDYDKDGDGKLSAEEQDKFLDDLQKIYAIDLPAEFQRQATTQEDATQARRTSEEDNMQDQDDAQELMAYDAQPSWNSNDVVTFFVAAITSAALTTLGVHAYRKFRAAPQQQDDYLILSA